MQIFRREAAATREYDAINAGHRDAYLISIRADAAMYALVEAIGVLAVALVAWWAVHDRGAGVQAVATLGLVVAFLSSTSTSSFIPIRDPSAKYAVMQGAMAAIERITELLDTEEPDAPAPATALFAAAPAAAAPLVAFDHLDFSYGAEPILHDVSRWRCRAARPSRSSAPPAPASRP